MLSEKDLVKGCKEYNIKAQQELYERFARKMMSVCYYYTGSTDDAKDLLQEGFIKIFAKIGQYKEEGSLEGWIRRLIANAAIDFLNKKKIKQDSISSIEIEDNSDIEYTETEYDDQEMDFSQEEIMMTVNKLPNSYRLVFNMFCLEDFSHKEIAERLHITEGNSRARLKKARLMLRGYLNEIRQLKKVGVDARKEL